MDLITEAELRQLAPNAASEYVTALANLSPEIERQGVNTPGILCEFLGQMAHESDGFTLMRENTRWTPEQMKDLWPDRFPLGKFDPRIIACKGDEVKLANLAYSNRAELGNRGGDDGWLFRAGGINGLTGRDNYRAAGQALGINLEARPELIQRGDIAVKVALWYWTKLDCNRFAKRGYTRAVGNAINRGNPYASDEPIGAASRLRWRNMALRVFGDGEKPFDDGLALGAFGSEVEVLQKRLRDLNYGLGAQDQVFGPATARAVVSFKYDHKQRTGEEVEPDEIVSAKTWAQLNMGEPVIYANREGTTVADLRAQGSQTITQADGAQALAAAGTTALVAKTVAENTDVVSTVSSTFEWAPRMHSTVMPMAEAAVWGAKNLGLVVGIVAFALIWRKFGNVMVARLRDHIRGFNLGR